MNVQDYVNKKNSVEYEVSSDRMGEMYKSYCLNAGIAIGSEFVGPLLLNTKLGQSVLSKGPEYLNNITRKIGYQSSLFVNVTKTTFIGKYKNTVYYNRLAKESKDVINFVNKQEAKDFSNNFVNKSVINKFFGKATGKAHSFQVTKLKNDQYLVEYLSKSEIIGGNKRFIKVIDSVGNQVLSYKETLRTTFYNKIINIETKF